MDGESGENGGLSIGVTRALASRRLTPETLGSFHRTGPMRMVAIHTGNLAGIPAAAASSVSRESTPVASGLPPCQRPSRFERRKDAGTPGKGEAVELVANGENSGNRSRMSRQP